MGGKKGGGSSHTPVEAKETGRSFQIARMLEVISEGEIYGFVDDTCSVFLDKTPLQNKDGSYNFKNISVYATSGTQDQDVLTEFTAVEKEIDVNTKILKDKPIIKTVTDANVNRIRMTLGVERLLKQENNGDTNPTSVSMTVEVLKNNRVTTSRTYTFNGKYSSAYREMFDLVVPKPPFSIRVSRVEPDSDTQKLQNACFWSSYTEITDKEFAYPNTALVGIKIDSEYFSNIPTRNYEIYGLMVKVPSNYDAFNHRYTSDFWDGSFKVSWTNNPAWVFYDLVTNTRYGMGQRLGDFGIDKWQLYAIGRYCDELVPDGYGGKEPRMTCNMWVTDQKKAYDLINDICSIFRAMPVWNGQALTAIQDRASDPVWTYNNANTMGGFTRQRSAKKARHNVIQVEYIDGSDFYEKKVESVSDDALVARYGQNVKKVTAFGCTSRGQAYRTGRWILETEKLETETITFTVGQEGVMHLPYDVIEVADSQYAGTNIGGRVLAVNGTAVTLDREIEIDDESYLSYVSQRGITENVKIVSFDKETNIATVAKNLNGLPELTVWGLSTKRVTTGLYRAISIKENDSSDGKTYTITALQHVPEKEDIVVNGTHFDPKPQTVYGDVVDAQITYNGSKLTVSGKINGSYNVLSSNQVASYTVKLLKDGALVYIEKGLKTPDINVDDLENGNYVAEISSYNDRNQLLQTYTKSFVIDRPPVVTGIDILGHLSSIILTWDFIDDTTQTEIWASESDNIETAVLVERIIGRYYSHEIGAKQVRYYWLRHKRGVNVGKFDQIQGRKGESGTDLNAELELLNEKLSQNIIDEIIDVALPARKLGMLKSVDNLNVNVYAGSDNVVNGADNTIYVWDGKKYIPNKQRLLAEAIEGVLQPEQLAQIPTTQLKGTLTSSQIQSLDATKLTGNINIARIPSIPTNKLTGVLTDAQIQSLNASKLVGTVPIASVPTIPTNKLTGVLTDEQVQSLNATKLIGTVPIAQVPSIPTTKLTGSITDAQISTLNASKLTGTVSLDRLPSVPTTKLSGKITDAQLDKVSASKINGTLSISQIPEIPTTKLGGQLTDAQIQSVNATKIAGIIGVNQIASIPTTKLTGTITDAQIQSMNASKVSGVLNINSIPSVPTTKLTGKVSANQISANAIGANHIQAGVIGASHIQSDSIGADKLQANSVGANALQAGIVTAEKLATNSVDATKIKANSIGTNHLGANIVTSEKINAGAVNARAISANAIQSSHISANAIGANHITAGAIKASKMVMYGENMILDPLFEDKEYWRENIATNSAEPIEWANGKIVITLTNKSVSNGTYFFGLRPKFNFPLDKGRSYRLQCRIKVTGDSSIENLHTSAYLVSYPETTARNASTGWQNAGHTAKYGARDELVACNVTSFIATHNQVGVYLRVGCRATGNVITNAVVEFSEIELIKMSDAELIVDGAITAQKLQAEAVTADKIKASAITSDKIATNAVTAVKIQANAITAQKIATNAVTAVKIQANAVTTDKINANAITAQKIATNAVTAGKIATNAVTTDKINANAITAQKIATNAVTAGKIATNAVTAEKILANAITAQKIATNAVTAGKIATNAVTTDKINANAITAQKIATNAVEANKIKAGAVIAGKLATDAVLANNIKAEAITADKLQAGSVGTRALDALAVTAEKIQAGAITSAKIQANAINAQHINAGQISADKLAIGLGGNLLQNPIFANNANGWVVGAKSNSSLAFNVDYRKANGFTNWYPNDALDNEAVVMLRPTINSGVTTMGWIDPISREVKVNPNQWYIFSVYANVYRMPTGSVTVRVEEYSQKGAYVKLIGSQNVPINNAYGSAQHNIAGMGRYFVKFQAPASGLVSLRVRMQGTPNGNNPDVYVARPMLEECTQHATAPSAWQNAGVTSIHGGSIVTNTITAQQIQAGTITANEIAGNTITANKIAGGTITGDKIASKTINADRMNVSTLSALSANLGTITAGSININNRFKVSTNGVVELRSARNNVGMVINNDNLIVYDSNGKVRVKIGKLR